MITTSYTEQDNRDTLRRAPLSKYRLSHWMCGILQNFLADPVNVADERLRGLLGLGGPEPEERTGLIQVGLPFSGNGTAACRTPAVLASVGASSYPMRTINSATGCNGTLIGGIVRADRTELKTVELSVAVITESLDGTVLLTDLIEDFLLTHDRQLCLDGPVSSLSVRGSSAPDRISAGQGQNAKDLYQSVIGLSAVGSVHWTEDTQGPVFRGLRVHV